MPVRLFRSIDVNAPVLNGTAGALINLLDSILVNGYTLLGIASITRSGNTATVTLSAANATLVTGDRVTISGANEADYNGQFVITWLTSTTFTYTVDNNPTTPATGTLVYAKSAVGWTKEFSGTNLAAYRQPAGTSQFRLRVDDLSATNPRVVGYETMTDVNTGGNPFPTAAQISGGLHLVKSTTADATARPWVLLTNDKIIYLFINTTSAASPALSMLTFGDFTSYKAGDTFGCMISAATSAATTIAASQGAAVTCRLADTALIGHFVARDHTGIGGSTVCSKISNASLQGASTVSADQWPRPIGGATNSNTNAYVSMPYPNAVDAGLYVERIWITQGQNALRGELPGLWAPMHSSPLAHGETYSGTGALAGKTFEAHSFTTTYAGQVHLETSNTW